jgi:uncharacterized protein
MGTILPDTETLVGNLAELLAARAEEEGIAAAWLFGSVARGTTRPDSDVDIGILYQEDPPQTLAGIAKVHNLEEELIEVTDLPIQVVNLNLAPVDLVIRVLRDGKLLVGHDSLQRVDFEVRSRNEFWDLEPYLRLYRGRSVRAHDRRRARPQEARCDPQGGGLLECAPHWVQLSQPPPINQMNDWTSIKSRAP